MRLHGIALIGATSMLGRELTEALAETSAIEELRLLHGRIEVEGHDIVQIAGHASLATAIDGDDALEGLEVAIVLDHIEGHGARRLAQAMDAGLQVLVVDTAHAPDLELEVLRAGDFPEFLQHRLPAPELHAASLLAELFEPDLEHLTLFSQRPASIRGNEGVEDFAKAVTARMSGQPISPDSPPAFDTRIVDDPIFEADAMTLFPTLEPLVRALASSCFHGHWAQLSLGLQRSLHRQEVLELMQGSDALVLHESDLHVQSVVESDAIHCALPSLSSDGRRVAFDLAFDGLRVGAANRVIALLERWR